MLGIVVSRADAASVNIGERLLELADWEATTDDARPAADGGGTVYRLPGAELRTFDELHLHLDGVAEAFSDPDAVAFVSRHSGETGPLLSAHFTGNFGPAEYGGEAGTLARACPNTHAAVVEALSDRAPEGYDVGVECTHHGPTRVGAPSVFVELGSGEAEWRNPDGARAVARAVLDLRGVAADRPDESSRADGDGAGTRHLVGFGGGHYAPRFERIIRETDWAVGHVAADWPLDAMGSPAANRDVVAAAFERSAAEYAVVEGTRPKLESVVEELGYRVVGETWARETTGIDLARVEALEAALGTVDEGVRFGALAERGVNEEGDSGADEFEVLPLPAELLSEAQGIDADAVRAAVREHTLAFRTEEGGTRAVDRAAVRDGSDRAALVDALVAVLGGKYESVERRDGEVVARETVFDPDRARTLGVPEGPAFGKLSAGEAVEVNGERIDPAVVRRERTVRFPL